MKHVSVSTSHGFAASTQRSLGCFLSGSVHWPPSSPHFSVSCQDHLPLFFRGAEVFKGKSALTLFSSVLLCSQLGLLSPLHSPADERSSVTSLFSHGPSLTFRKFASYLIGISMGVCMFGCIHREKRTSQLKDQLSSLPSSSVKYSGSRKTF